MLNQRRRGTTCLIIDCWHDQDLWESAYSPALSAALSTPRRELAARNLCDVGRIDSPITQSDLDAVATATLVVADTSGASARAHFLLGYAVASRKRIVYLHDRRSSRKFDFVGLRPWSYDSGLDLRSYLERVLVFVESSSVESTGDVLRDFMPRCGFPLAVLEGDGRYAYAPSRMGGERPIHVSLVPNEYVVPDTWRAPFARVLELQKEQADASGSVLFNGALVRIVDYTPERDENVGARGIRLSCQLTDYFTFVSSNHSWDHLNPTQYRQLREVESRDIADLRHSVLANPLTVSVSLVLRHLDREWIVIQRRNSNKNFHGKQDFVCAAAGMVSATRDRRSDEVDVYSTACNELREEAGINVSESQVVFLALLRETELREVGLVAEVELQADPAALIGTRADAFESQGFVLCEATPEGFASFLASNLPLSRFAPLSAGAIMMSLLRRFSRERVEAAFKANLS